MDSTQTSNDTSEQNDAKIENGDVDMARIEALLTPEQVFSDVVARKRRKFTKKHNPSFSKRESTPVRNLDDKTTTSDEEVPEQKPKTPERRRIRRSRSSTKQHYSGAESEPGQIIPDDGSREVSRSNSFRSERKKSLSDMAQEEVKQFLNKTKKSLTAAAIRGRERFKKYEKQQVKRSQSAPHEFTEAELIESFKKAQLLSAENQKARKFSDSSLQSLVTTESFQPKPLRPEAQLVIRQRKKQRQYSEKVVEILDPKASIMLLNKPVVKPQDTRISALDMMRVLRFLSLFEVYRIYKLYIIEKKDEYQKIKALWNKCMFELFLIMMFCGIGGIVFKFTEGSFENFYKCGVKRVKRDFIDLLWMKSHNLREDDWKLLARSKLRTFEEELHAAHEAGMTSYSGQRSWSFLNGVVYALTIVTTIGYGHIYPTTTTGRALTIVYSIIGIPLFLIALTDFGKLFTRGIKFLWSFVRRVYYTGSCRRVRKSGHVQEIFKGAQLMYDIATFRRASNQEPATDPENPEAAKSQNSVPTTAISEDATPTTPAISNYEIDDEFNLPISVALFILITYIFCGALIYSVWEQWDFFASFYFVFISMSTIGFGDFVPKHPICMIVSIVYLVFGLALMSMCINVVQLKLSDTFQQASAKLGASIGFEVDDSGSIITVDNVTGAAKAELLVPDSNIISPPTPVHKPSRNVPNSTAFPSTAATPSNFNTPDSDFAASTPGNPATEDNSSKNSD
nr:uncharacterized protein LOC111517179 isoform X1 [Leptinotarsa decemlineata]